MKKIAIILLSLLFNACQTYKRVSVAEATVAVNNTLDNWHKAAAEAKYDLYFDQMTSDGVFIGTDPNENWQNDAFRAFAKPYFDKGKAWSFTSVKRNVYFNEQQNIAWFDELLNTQMKICRGSGVMRNSNGRWKIAHYVLSITIPNENTDEVVKLKSEFDDKLLLKIK
ncbi:MAG TPA: nuclear transport factor 2 family protein [Flavobacterium sp.]